MRTQRVALRHASAASGRIPALALRELRGRDELSVEGVDTRAALALLDRLIDVPTLQAGSLCAADRDTLLAALHRREWGDRIVTTLTCVACGKRFDLSFTLSEVQAYLARTVGDATVTPPTAEQELRAAEQGAHAGVAALAREIGIDAGDVERVAAQLENQVPILDLEIGAPCAECGHEQEAHFDVQSFVLQRLLGERTLLLSEIHILAANYGWSLREIVSLPRSVRKSLAQTLDDARAFTR